MADEYDQQKAFEEELAKITDETIKDKLKKVKDLVVKRINLEKEFRIEQCKLEAVYEAKYAPLYVERSDIINGKTNVNVEELKDVLPEVKLQSSDNTETGIPDYWLTCLKNSSQFGEMITAKDEKILKHLTDITLEYNQSGDFTLFLGFSENDFFGHKQLKREFLLDDKKNIKSINSSEITWNSEEVNPTVAKKKKKVKAKGKSEVKTITKTEECQSFFNFFKNYTAKDLKDMNKNEDVEEDEMDDDMYIEEEYDLGVFIKDELIPYSLEYYLNIVDEEDDDMEEDEDMEDNEDMEDDEDMEKPKKKKLF
jgi:nucleosome assembly protein 1-like 1